jgi:hypothetical protein
MPKQAGGGSIQDYCKLMHVTPCYMHRRHHVGDSWSESRGLWARIYEALYTNFREFVFQAIG